MAGRRVDQGCEELVGGLDLRFADFVVVLRDFAVIARKRKRNLGDGVYRLVDAIGAPARSVR